MITAEGADAYAKMLFRGDATIVVPATGNFYIGLCNQVPDQEDTLVDIVTEPSAAGGYARIAIQRSSAGWPVIAPVNGKTKIESLAALFEASGADFDQAFTRAFLCNVASGTAGVLFAYSGALNAPLLLLDGESRSVKFEHFWK